jgi:hypothetical protein
MPSASPALFSLGHVEFSASNGYIWAPSRMDNGFVPFTASDIAPQEVSDETAQPSAVDAPLAAISSIVFAATNHG